MKTLEAETVRSRLSWKMSVRRKRHCARCGTRVSRSSNKCGYCGRFSLSRKSIAAGVAVTALMFISLLFLLGLFPGVN
jgi:hypothetical protein